MDWRRYGGYAFWLLFWPAWILAMFAVGRWLADLLGRG